MTAVGLGRQPLLSRRALSVTLAVSVLAVGTMAWAGRGLTSGGGVQAPAFALAGQPAPPLAGPTVQGGRADLADFRGSVVLVNVWASWCGPCRQELPLLTEAQRRLGPRGLRVVGLLMKDGEVPARNLLRELGAMEITSIEDPEGVQAIGWGIRGIPETFLVDRDGRVRQLWIGPLNADWLDHTVEPMLTAPGSP